MAEETVTKSAPETDGEAETWKRRGLLAAAWAAVAAIVAKQTTALVEAGVDGDVVLGSSNNETTKTFIANTTGSGIVLQLANQSGTNTYGVGLDSNGSFGVIGRSNTVTPLFGAGVYGESIQPSGFESPGVWGFSNRGPGVLGQSSGGDAIRGEIAGANLNIAIYGLNNSSYAGGSPGAGGFAIYGLCAKGHGLVGATAAAGAAAVVGATNGVAGAYAGAFYGPVVVGGDFTVFGAKSAAVPHPDGSHRLLYCMESPESWFEDFGKGQLQCGQADVTIDPNFAAVADMDDYHVFVTEYGQHNGVYVTEQTPAGFRVKGGDEATKGAFSWRVVAKRKDIVGERLAKVTMPPEPQLPTPGTPEAPTPPVVGQR